MENKMDSLIKLLISKGKTISTMESCTGGGLANAITDIEGASEVLKFGAITYSNEYKIKMGVDASVIEKHSVYSMETANEMSKKISLFTSSDYGVGITGKLNRVDSNNPIGLDNIVFISIYDSKNNIFYNDSIEVMLESRSNNKKTILNRIVEMLLDILKSL